MKKFYYIATFILFIAMILCFTNISNASYLYGDVNSDGKLTSADSKLILKFSLKLKKPSAIQSELADIDNNGRISLVDSIIASQMANGRKKTIKCPSR